MNKIDKKQKLILEKERQFANLLALQVLYKPTLIAWMIFIPIVFIYYFYQYQKFSNGRKKFVENFLINKKRAMIEAMEVVNEGRKPDIEKLAKFTKVPEKVQERQAKVLKILVDHFISLLKSDGNDFKSLVHSAYSDRSKYTQFLNSLNNAEKSVNSIIKPGLQKKNQDAIEIINKMEIHSEKIRQESALDLFP